MDLMLNEDQLAVQDAIESIALDYSASPVDFHGFALLSPELDQVLTDNGFFDIASIPELGPLTAAVAVERLARLPYTAETALSMLVGHALAAGVPRPIAIVENGRPGRFVAQAKTVIVVDKDRVGISHPNSSQVKSLPEALYAYPMAKLSSSVEVEWLDKDTAQRVKTWIRIALANEMAGLIKGAIDSTVEYLSVRKQFGRPLGAFQALRHRLSECTVLAGGVKWLALKAAWSGDAGDAALAAFHAQDSATRVIYDVHQMSGAMGMTLEMDLHLWTYRMKALLSELGGRGGQATAVGHQVFGVQ
jgi:hypothetical protein